MLVDTHAEPPTKWAPSNQLSTFEVNYIIFLKFRKSSQNIFKQNLQIHVSLSYLVRPLEISIKIAQQSYDALESLADLVLDCNSSSSAVQTSWQFNNIPIDNNDDRYEVIRLKRLRHKD